jgi:hypothetical protein
MASDPTELRCSSPESSGDAGAEDPAAVDAAEESGGEGGSGHIAAGTEAAPPRPPEPEPEKVARHGVLPLLGKPYFTCIMCKSHVQPPFQVVKPKKNKSKPKITALLLISSDSSSLNFDLIGE